MHISQKIFAGFILCGIIFSSIFRICFTYNDGIEFHSVWWQMLPFKVLDFNSQNSEQLFLTSTVVGYLFYLLAGMISVLTNHFKNTPSFFRVIFVFITLYAVYFETAAIIIAFHSEFSGQHLWVGTALFLYGLLIIFYKTKPVSVKGKVKTDRIKFMSDPK